MTRRTITVNVTHCTAIDAATPLAALDLAHACGAPLEWVTELASAGIVATRAQSTRIEEWRFDSADLRQALEARRLQRDFDVGLDAAALILELQREVRRLKRLLGGDGTTL